MNLIALVTLNAIIKLELIALYHVVSQNDNYTSKAWKTRAYSLYQDVYQYINSSFPWRQFWGMLNPFYKSGITFCDVTFVLSLPVCIIKTVNPSLSMLVVQCLARFEIVCIEMLLFWFCQSYDPNSKVYKDASLLDETIFYHKYERYPVLYGHRHNSNIFTKGMFALTA